jgi:hypothetical protein
MTSTVCRIATLECDVEEHPFYIREQAQVWHVWAYRVPLRRVRFECQC